MCDPVTATVLAVTTAAAGVVSQIQSANAQNKAIAQTYQQQQKQIDEKASDETNDRLMQARQEQSRIKVAAGESGLQLGGSVNTLLNDAGMQASLAGDTIATNKENESLSAVDQANSAYSRVQKPTILGAGLQIATAGLGAYSSASARALSISRASTQSMGSAASSQVEI